MTAVALAVAPVSSALAQQAKGPPVIRDTEAEQLLREYTRPILRAAAAITSITMNGGTSLRPDAVRSCLARSLSVASSIDICYLTWRPRLAAFRGLLGHIRYRPRRQSLKTDRCCSA